MWTAGIAATTGVIAGWRIVGSGYSRLAAAVVLLLGVAAATTGGGSIAWVGSIAALTAVFVAPFTRLYVVLIAASSASFIAVAIDGSSSFLAVTGALFLGLITAEMMLGHWYLVDPRLPRWALQGLVLGALVALIVDFTYLTTVGALDWGTGEEVLGWAFLVLTFFSAVLTIAVSLSLREPFYTGVMAATGLSYLAVLTAFGSVVLGRLLID